MLVYLLLIPNGCLVVKYMEWTANVHLLVLNRDPLKLVHLLSRGCWVRLVGAVIGEGRHGNVNRISAMG